MNGTSPFEWVGNIQPMNKHNLWETTNAMEGNKPGQGRWGRGDTQSHHFDVYRPSSRVGSCEAQQLEEKKENGSYQQCCVAGSKNHRRYFKHRGIDQREAGAYVVKLVRPL